MVIVARSKKPMIDAAEHNYRVVDPYYSFYGYVDPKLTATFGSEDPMERNLVILVVHGDGKEAWRSETPKAKFVIINIAVKTIAVKKMRVTRKNVAPAIYMEEATGDQMTSAVFWDGKRYRYTPMGSSME